jgi:serine/threonine protein phosphatase 1
MTDRTEGQRIYAVGDVHGQLGQLEAMIDRIAADLMARPHPRPRLVMLGDYVDRGPDSRGVIDTLIHLRDSDLPTTFLLGNHDSYVLEYLRDPEWFDRALHWLHPSMGGAATLASYGVPGARDTLPELTHEAFGAAFPAAHRRFLENCALLHRSGDYVFAHAGIRPGVPLDAQARDDLIWIREPFLSFPGPFPFKVVHGHTIVPEVQHHPTRIAVDTGAGKGRELSCVVLEGEDAAVLTPEGPRPLPLGAGLGLRGMALGLRERWLGRG